MDEWIQGNLLGDSAHGSLYYAILGIYSKMFPSMWDHNAFINLKIQVSVPRNNLEFYFLFILVF
jgi:hypothetical protein